MAVQADTRVVKELYIWTLSTAFMPAIQLIVCSLKSELERVFNRKFVSTQVRDQGPKQATEREQRRSLGL